MSKFIDMTPTWGATLRIYGLALRNADLDGAGEQNAFAGLQEAANHLDNTYPNRIAALKTKMQATVDAYEAMQDITDGDLCVAIEGLIDELS